MDIKIINCDLQYKKHADNFVSLLNEYINDSMGGGIPYDVGTKDKLINDLLDLSTTLIFFAVYQDKFIGMAVCFIGYSTFNAKKLINIHDIIVLKGFRNKGVGKAIINAICEKGKELDCCKITLEVRCDNKKAIHLYEKLGFKDSNPSMLFWHKIILGKR